MKYQGFAGLGNRKKLQIGKETGSRVVTKKQGNASTRFPVSDELEPSCHAGLFNGS